MRGRMLGLIAMISVACAAPANDHDGTTLAPVAALRLLFLGNSLTYGHDVPQIVVRMSAAVGRAPSLVTTRAAPNLGLEDHWNDPETRALISSGSYDVVIMQQGPSTLPASRVDLLRWAGVVSAEARRSGARPAIYGVWPPRGGDIDAGIVNHADAAQANEALLIPVAAAWRETWAIDPSMPLYGPDDFHPSVHGAWLAALVISAVVHDLPPSTFPNTYPGTITEAQVRVLRSAAATALSARR